MAVLSIDPGGNIGWAVFRDDGGLLAKGKMKFDLFAHSLHYKPAAGSTTLTFVPRGSNIAEVKISKVVYESYYLDPDRPQGGSTGPAQEVIGVLKYLCLQAGIEPVAQRAVILRVAMQHEGYVQDKAHLPDEDSAELHGRYFFRKQAGVLT
jgi:hypothetical protein